MVAEHDALKERIMRDKPVAVQLHQLVNRCQALEKKHDRQSEHVKAVEQNIQDLQAQLSDARD
eukprot:3677677-Pyramimonas_sp.AAC.1